MFGDTENLSKNLNIHIRFDADAHLISPDHCIKYSLCDDSNYQIHAVNDFSRATDEELSIGITTIRAVLSHLEKEEYDRFLFKNRTSHENLPEEIKKLIETVDKKES